MWRLEVRDPTGAFKYYRDLNSPVDELSSFSVGGDGDSHEAQFKALASGLGVKGRDVVTLALWQGGEWKAVFSGVATKPGAKLSPDVSSFKLVGLKKRFAETENPLHVMPGADVAVQVHSLRDALPAGVRYDSARIPFLSFTNGERLPQFETLAATLDALAALCPGFVVPEGETYTYGNGSNSVTYGPGDEVSPVTWGVQADRTFFFGRAQGEMSLQEGAGVAVNWREPDAEKTVTAVRLVLGRGPKDALIYRKINGVSQDPESASGGFLSYRVDSPAIDTYGEALKTVALPLSPAYFKAPPIRQNARFDNFAGFLTDLDAAAWNESNEALQTDKRGFFFERTEHMPPGIPDVVGFRLEMTRSAGEVAFKGGQQTIEVNLFENIPLGNGNFDTGDAVGFDIRGELPFGLALFSDRLRRVYADGDVTHLSSISAKVTASSDYTVRHAYPLVFNAEVLDRIAQSYFYIPPADPADIDLYGRYQAPAPSATLSTAQGETLTRQVAAVTYHLSREQGLVSTVKLEQAMSAELSALNVVLQGKADDAALSAMTYTNAQ